MKILIIDDEKALTDAIGAILKKNNYFADCVNDAEDGLDMALTEVYDLIILDIMMPKIDGITLLKTLRREKVFTPVLMLSAKSETSDKISGLDSGADDYLAKPFDSSELMARIKALLRRRGDFTGDTLSFGDLSLDKDSFKLICKGNSISLGKKEFQILEMLILSSGKCVNKEKIIEKIWGYDSEAEYNTIEVYVSFIRRKLAAVESLTEIKSVRGVGYNLEYKND